MLGFNVRPRVAQVGRDGQSGRNTLSGSVRGRAGRIVPKPESSFEWRTRSWRKSDSSLRFPVIPAKLVPANAESENLLRKPSEMRRWWTRFPLAREWPWLANVVIKSEIGGAYPLEMLKMRIDPTMSMKTNVT